MKKSKRDQRKWGKVKNHPPKTWEDTPRFCAEDFAFTGEEKELFENWKKIMNLIEKAPK